MTATPGLINVFGSSTAVAPAAIPSLLEQTASAASASGTMIVLNGSFKGISMLGLRPTGVLNSGDYYYDVVRGGLLITDGAGNWFNPFSVALPPQ